jgi:hypothetical protein
VFKVYWNNQLIGTYDPSSAAFQTATLSVIAQAGANVLRFQGAGALTNAGASLDNVRLYKDDAVATVDHAPTGLQLLSVAATNDLTALAVVGNASHIGGNEYQLTPNSGNQAGAVWGSVDLSQDVTWTTQMYFGANDGGADGLSFALQAQGANLLGAAGGSTLGTLVSGTYGIAFDTYSNGGEPNADFSQFTLNGNRDDISFDAFHSYANLEDNAWHNVVIQWNAATHTLSYSVDCVAIASKSYDAVNLLFNGNSEVWFGFGAGTVDQAMISAFAFSMSTLVLRSIISPWCVERPLAPSSVSWKVSTRMWVTP